MARAVREVRQGRVGEVGALRRGDDADAGGVGHGGPGRGPPDEETADGQERNNTRRSQLRRSSTSSEDTKHRARLQGQAVLVRRAKDERADAHGRGDGGHPTGDGQP